MKRYMIMMLLIIATLAISGCTSEEAPVEETVKEVPLALDMMKQDIIEYTYVSVGEVIPRNRLDMNIAGGGFIEEIFVEVGDTVEEGLVLIRLDGSEMDMTNYNATESQLRTVRDNIASQLTSARDNYARQEALFQEGVITKLELDQVQLQIESLEREYANAKSAYRNQLAIIKDGLEDASESRFIESTVSGTIAALYVEEGQQANGQLGITIIDGTENYVQTHVSGEMMKQLSVGDNVRLKLDGGDESMSIGTIAEIKTLPDPQNMLFEVLIEYEQQDNWIFGDYTEVEFIIDRYQAVMIPSSSVVRKGNSKHIYTYNDGQLSKVFVEVGRSKGAWLEVTNIDDLTQVVVRGQEQLISEESPFAIIE